MAFSGVLSKFSQKANSLFSNPPEFTVINDRVYTMPPPTSDGGRQDVAAVANHLKSKYGEHFMIWNLSEKTYNYDLFDNQVLEFKFPGYPCPPLSILVELIKSVRSWLDADPTNVSIVHCATGHVRTATVVACQLAFCGAFPSVNDALSHYYRVMKLEPAAVTIPSQLRYINYFSQVLDGFDPKDRPLFLQCIVADKIPMLTKTTPCIQIFENSQLVFSSSKATAEILGEGTVSFPVNHVISGDVLIRSRQPTSAPAPGKKPSMTSIFRINLHTAFVTSELVRLSKDELDGPHRESHWSDGMFVDLIFSPFGDLITSPDGSSGEAAGNPSVWEIARKEQSHHDDPETVVQSEDDYKPYAPYISRSRKNSLTEDELEAEIASAQPEQNPVTEDEFEAELAAELPKDSAVTEDEFEAEIAGAQLSDTEEDGLAGLSNEELMDAVDLLPTASPVAKTGGSSISTAAELARAESSTSEAAVVAEVAAGEDSQVGKEAHSDGEELDLLGQMLTDLGEGELVGGEIDDELVGGDIDVDEAWMAELEAELAADQ